MAVVLLKRGRLGRHVDAGAELLGLDDRPLGKLRAGDSRGEPGVVLDPRGGAGLTTCRHRVEYDRRQTFGGAVDGGGQPGRAPAPTITRSQTALGGQGYRRPIVLASSALLGLRNTCFPRQITTEVSSAVMPSRHSNASATSSFSRSTHRCGSRLRAQNSRSRRVSGE